MKIIMYTVIILIVGILAFTLLNSNKSSNPGVVNNNGSTSNAKGEDTQNDKTEGTVVVGDHLSFAPNRIEVSAGQKVTVTFKSVDDIHDFVIDELDVDSGLIGRNQSTTLTFTIPADAKSGDTYEYYCSVDSHRANGMVGTIVVK